MANGRTAATSGSSGLKQDVYSQTLGVPHPSSIMRPTRLLLSVVLSFFTVFLTLYSVILSRPRSRSSAATAIDGPGGFSSLFSFRAPASLFPPSAVISLTDDNSTFFLSRPAAYGPALPSQGLSGQLWIGSGFLDDVFAEGAVHKQGGEEFGCSDIPGWPAGRYHRGEGHADGTKEMVSSRDVASKKGEGSDDLMNSDGLSPPDEDDGTDEYLHWPLPATPLLKAPLKSKNQASSEHADIQSLQESAEITGKVVLLSRGGCGFLEKTKWVQRRGGIALIVGDNTRGGPLVNMYAHADTSNVTIPSLFTSHTTAHLLCSLMPPEANFGPLPLPESNSIENAGPGEKQQANKGLDGPNFTPAALDKTGPTSTPRPGQSQGHSSAEDDDDKGWLGGVFSGGNKKDDGQGLSQDSRRPPSSGRLSWVQSNDWDGKPKHQSKDSIKSPTNKASSKKDSDPGAGKSSSQPFNDGFEIGVQDWRDPDLVNKASDAQGARTQSTVLTSAKTPIPTAVKGSDAKTLPGGSRAPGSGEYHKPNHKSEQNKPKSGSLSAKPSKPSKQTWGWFSFLRGSDRTKVSKSPNPKQSESNSGTSTGQAGKDKDQSPAPRPKDRGLWVTMTPTSVSTSPFFDTLLILVVSPLVTLTIVYALLLLRSRIRRRRWRAPKSVVERLPVRTYHTMSCSTSARSSHTPSPDASSATSPLLHSVSSCSTNRHRPRSQTLGVLRQNADSSLNRATALASLSSEEKPSPKKRYSGCQVECVVCLEEYVDGQSRVMSLPCGHEFHADCMLVISPSWASVG